MSPDASVSFELPLLSSVIPAPIDGVADDDDEACDPEPLLPAFPQAVIPKARNADKRIDKYMEFINPEDYSYKLKFVEDKIKNKGPISGILTGLENISSEYAIVFPCDNPFVTKNTIQTLFNEITCNIQAVVPYHDPENKLKTSEPLHSIYNKNIIPLIDNLILNDSLHIKGIIEKIDTKFVLIDNKKILKKEFRNLNHPEDLKIFN